MDFTKFEAKLDKLDDRLDSVDKTLAVQAEQLATHIKRTELAETNLEMLRNELKPIQAHVNRVDGALKLIGLAGIVVALVQSIRAMLG